MKFSSAAAFLLLLNSAPCLAQDSQPTSKLLEQAQHEYASKKVAEAEHDFRELTKRLPSSVYMHIYLGQTLFEQQKFAEAVGPFEKARELELAGSKLSSDQHRILIDQLAMAYGIIGDIKKTHALLEGAIQKDPEYPINYYNLACAFAEDGDKTKMLANLSLAFQHREHLMKGEKMPDPRTDLSFQKYLRDDDFIKLMMKLATSDPSGGRVASPCRLHRPSTRTEIRGGEDRRRK